MIYHIATKTDWQQAKKKDIYTCASLVSDGFIHCSSKDQVILVAIIMFKGRKDLVLLSIEETKVKPKVVFEDLKGHGTFPHIYGELNLDAVVDFCDLPVDQDGGFKLPDIVK